LAAISCGAGRAKLMLILFYRLIGFDDQPDGACHQDLDPSGSSCGDTHHKA